MKILAFPRDANPYQELLYQPMRQQGVAVQYLEGPTGSQTLNLVLLPLLLTVWRLRGFNVLHVHWTFPFRLSFGGALGRLIMEAWAALCWLLVKLYGMQLVWTAHNAEPHEPIFANDHRAHRFLARCADRVIVHTPGAHAQLAAAGITAKRLAVIPHGSYIGHYPDTVSRSEARKYLELPARAPVLLLFGLIRPSKGAEQLLEAFQQLPKHTVLVIAGSVADAGLRQKLAQAAEQTPGRIRLALHYIPDDELQYFFRSADFTVLPYEKSTTSGVALLACSFASPIVAPNQPAFADIPEAAQISYEPDGLADALLRAVQTPAVQQERYSAAAVAYAGQLSWEVIAQRTLDFLKGKA
jgi:beta-1,4-mannosyltransferase